MHEFFKKMTSIKKLPNKVLANGIFGQSGKESCQKVRFRNNCFPLFRYLALPLLGSFPLISLVSLSPVVVVPQWSGFRLWVKSILLK